jgi:manganese/zinc/iron transport system substrate-binding protein
MLKKFAYIIVLVSLVLAGCRPVGASNLDFSDRTIRVVATTGMVGDLVENIGGERVQVITLMGPGVDPHLYSASEGDVATLASADLIFYNGLDLEAQMGRVFERMEGSIRTIAVAEGVDRSLLLESADYEGQFDPHIWFDVTLWMEAVKVVQDVLVEFDPDHAELYQGNAESYLEELNELHAYVLAQAERITSEQRVLITAHDAFSYFGRAYGFQVEGLQGISTATEASAADVQALANLIVSHRIPAIFIETSVPTRTIEAVQNAVNAQGHEVAIGGELYSDALGNPGTPEGVYTGMVKANIDTIVNGLLGGND